MLCNVVKAKSPRETNRTVLTVDTITSGIFFPASFAHIFFLWDAKFLFQRVPGCNGIADLS